MLESSLGTSEGVVNVMPLGSDDGYDCKSLETTDGAVLGTNDGISVEQKALALNLYSLKYI